MAYTDAPDTMIAQLTLEGRNILARAKLGDIVYRQLGWQLGQDGYDHANPVKVDPITDAADTAMGYFEVLSNTSWQNGTKITINGTDVIYGTHFLAGATADLTVINMRDAVWDSTDPNHYRLVEPVINPSFPERLYIRSLVTGDVGNGFPLSFLNVKAVPSDPDNLSSVDMAGGVSATLGSPVYPTIATLAPYTGDDGLVEMPADTAASFMSRIGEGTDGQLAYGELGLWVEILESGFPGEVGREVLYATSHFPIQPKTDRSIVTFRIIISF